MWLTWLLSLGVAVAQEEVCSGSFTNAELGAAMDIVDQQIAKADANEARFLLQQMHPKVPCLGEPASPELVARYAIQRAQVAYFDQDEATAARWLRLAEGTLDGGAFPDGYPDPHPLRDVLEAADPVELSGPGGGLLVPKKSVFLLNGSAAVEPVWRIDIPALVQVFDNKNERVAAFWQDGSMFDPTYVDPEGGMIEAPSWWTGPVRAPSGFTAAPPVGGAEPDTGSKGEKEPKERTGDGPNLGRLALGAGTGAVAAVLYGVAAASSGGLDGAADEAALAAVRSRTNLLVVGSGVAGATALGISVTAFVSSSGTGVGLALRF